MRECKLDGCDNEVVGNKRKRFCCQKCYRAAWYIANKERENEASAAWSAANKERKAETNAAWYAANKERKAETTAAWAAANPEKLRAKTARRRALKACVVPQRWVKRSDVPDELCYWCGSSEVSHIDHIMPISLGGPATESNEVGSCAGCNLSKSAKHPLVWIAELIEKDISK